MSIARIKKNDTVVVRSGDFAGMTGKVLRVDYSSDVAYVEGINLVKATVRRSKEKPDGGFREVHKPLKLSKIMPYDANLKKGVRITRVRSADKLVRRAKKTGKILD
jgi:large subunit ribosomal protein L24